MGNMRADLTSSIIHLLRKEPYFAALIMGMKTYSTTGIPTAGVNIKEGRVNLYINPYFWNSMEVKEQAEVLKHECYHIINNHIARFKDEFDLDKKKEAPAETEEEFVKQVQKKFKDMKLQKRANFAADLAINEYLPALPEKMYLFDQNGNNLINEKGEKSFGKPLKVKDMQKQFPEMLHQKHAEYYYEFLKNNKPEKGQGQPGEGEPGEGEFSTVDDHSIWGDSELDPEQIKEICKGAVNKAAETVGGRESGHIPSDVLRAIEDMNKSSNNWRNILRRFVASSTSLDFEDTRKKRNRRYGTLVPGYKTHPELHLFVGVDTSGSIEGAVFNQFIAEIDAIHKAGAKITIAVCDAHVHSVSEYSKRKKIEFKGGGGTLYQPMIEEAKKSQCDAMVIFGDGYCSDRLTKPGFPVLWALVDGGKKPNGCDFGSEIKVEVKKK